MLSDVNKQKINGWIATLRAALDEYAATGDINQHFVNHNAVAVEMARTIHSY